MGLKRTHTVTGNLIHNHKYYRPGSTITYDDDFPDELIQAQIDAGNLAGPRATQLERERIIAQAQHGIAAMSPDEVARMWNGYGRMSEEQRRAREDAEAKEQANAEAQRKQSIDSAPRAPVTDIPPLPLAEQEMNATSKEGVTEAKPDAHQQEAAAAAEQESATKGKAVR